MSRVTCHARRGGGLRKLGSNAFASEFARACLLTRARNPCARIPNATQVNLESRQYVIPDEKRRDDVRWQARVMMHS